MQKLKRILSPGRLIAFVLTLVLVYYAWGFVFTPGGTGSNVVLGLLLALAAVYLLTTNLGPYLDETFFAKGNREALQLSRYAEGLVDDVERALKRDAKKKRPVANEKARDALKERVAALKQALHDVEHPAGDGKPTDAQVDHLRGAIDAVDKEVQAAYGNAQGGVFTQLRSLGIAFAVALALRAFVVEPFQIPSSSMIPTLLIGDHLFVARFMYGLQMPFSKEPTYLVRWSVPKPGDVVVFVAPPHVGSNAGDDWIKRVIAGPGQRVRIVDTVLYVDDVPYEHVNTGPAEGYVDYNEGMRRWTHESARPVKERIGDEVHDIYISEPPQPITVNWPAPNVRGLTGLQCDEVECTVEPGYVFVMGDNRDQSSDGRRWGAVPIDNVKGQALFIWMSVDGSERSVDLGRFTLPSFRWERLFQSID